MRIKITITDDDTPNLVLQQGDTLRFTWMDIDGDAELVAYSVVPEPLREEAAVAELRRELAEFGGER